MAIATAFEALIGRPVQPNVNPITGTVATTATRILANNPNRVQWIAINLSANDGFVGFSGDVSSTKGIRLPANGGNVSLVYTEDFALLFVEVYAINLTATGTWYIVELVGY